MIVTLKAGESRFFPNANTYLNVIAASDIFVISNSSLGLSPITVKSGWILDMAAYPSLDVFNPTDNPITLELESQPVKISAGGGESVFISNKPVIQRIEEAIQVNAQATVENGTVHIVPGTSINDVQDKTVNAGAKVQLLAANPNRKSVLVQVISATRTDLRIGSSTVAAGRGVYVAGSKAAPGVMPIESTGAIYAFNESNETALLSVTEVVK